MRHEHDPLGTGIADRDLPLLSKGMIGIGKGQGQWIEEDRRRLFKGYTVLPGREFT